MRFRGTAAIVALAVALTAATAASQPSAGDKAAAQGLFDQAKDLQTKGDVARACPMFEESQRLDPQQGTQFYLAKCYAASGRLASAWTLFIEVADAARSAGQADREKVARQHADALAPRIPRLVLAIPEGVAEVRRDGSLVGKAQWSTPVPVDPGTHSIRASAPGKTTYEGTIEVPEAKTTTLTVPALVDAPVDAPPSPAPPPPLTSASSAASTSAPPPPVAESGLGTQRYLALAAGGVGVVGVVLGSVFGLSSKSKHDDAAPRCPANQCDATGFQLKNDARSAGTLSTVFFAIGVAGVGGGAALWLTAPSSGETTGLRLSPTVGPHIAGAHLSGAW